MEKLGVFLCKGCQIGEALDTDEFEALVEEHGASTYECHDCLCSPEGVATILVAPRTVAATARTATGIAAAWDPSAARGRPASATTRTRSSPGELAYPPISLARRRQAI